jgi:hypothetical protein
MGVNKESMVIKAFATSNYKEISRIKSCGK